mmetsp:Transcript_19651/g.33470  ORF Transcript_19651/g.33470 Transcript_19651/m.33470 type:complete len:507 (+) Transcript_19651:108-1628(+)
MSEASEPKNGVDISNTASSKNDQPKILPSRENPFIPPKQRTIDDFIFDKNKKIGEGTYGTVFRARDKKTQEVVALKQFRISQKEDGLPITAVREIKLLTSLNHDNVISLKEIILDAEVNRNRDSESIYLVFEFMDHDLAGLIKLQTHNFIPGQIQCYIKQLLEGLYHCHAKNILHRDIKGANMLLNSKGILKLADFGLARKMGKNNSRFTRPVVTLWYRSPELLLGCKTYTSAIDMWSVGCLLVELYTGTPLFPGTTEADQIHKIYELCGTPSVDNWPEGMQLPEYKNLIPKVKHKRTLKSYLRKINRNITEQALDLIDRLLSLDPNQRLSAVKALDHPYFFTAPKPLSPSELPKYEGHLNELFAKQHHQQQQQHRTDNRRPPPRDVPPPSKRHKGNDGRGRYREPYRDAPRDQPYHRDSHNGRDYRDRDRDRDYRDSRQPQTRRYYDNRPQQRPYGSRNPEYQPPRRSTIRHDENPQSDISKDMNLPDPLVATQPKPPRDYREVD